MKFLLKVFILAWLSLLTYGLMFAIQEIITIEQVLKVTVMKVFPQTQLRIE